MRHSNPLPAPELLWESFSYSPFTGELRTLKAKRGWSVGRVIGGRVDARGYIRTEIGGNMYRLHRLVWCWVTGEDPGYLEVDHIDGNKSNNRWENLRLATHQQNCTNTSAYSNNQSGFKGVQQVRTKWRAVTRAGGKLRHIGYFDTPEEAHAAYCRAAKELHDPRFWKPQ